MATNFSIITGWFVVFSTLMTVSASGIDLCPRQRDKFEHLLPYKDQCLQLMTGNDSKQWLYAHQDCLLQGGDLLEITDAEMQKFVMSKLHDISQFDIWLGITDSVIEGKWVWVSEHTLSHSQSGTRGHALYKYIIKVRHRSLIIGASAEEHYSNWYPGQGPAQHDVLLADFMDCGILKYHDSGYWYNYPCVSPIGFDFNYICQYGTVRNRTAGSQQLGK